MNKQQLAARIWSLANNMRSKVEASDYKDYILGFIFYKYLSDKERNFLLKNGFTEETLSLLTEEQQELVKYCKNNLGYFIGYPYLFSSWLEKGRQFTMADVTEGLSAFSRHLEQSSANVYKGIFSALEARITEFSRSQTNQSKTMYDLLTLIKDIPTDGSQGYDVLGYVYEYLISNFAANAGKKAGEFYTPHEVALLMAEIVADHLKGREKISIYDPTSGSGSLLINIGRALGKHLDPGKIQYYAQELKENTYNLTRMNLVMRGINPSNIEVRNADTLESDWPIEYDSLQGEKPLQLDAVVSNPPYSNKWNPIGKENDQRFSGFGIAPQGKADYAFLLHDLYHLKAWGIVAIVLPHGVLFRGDAEGEIRKNLIENNHIDTVIGLPANIFFGTGIPTIIMLLKQNRNNDDVLFIDASRGFEKAGKKNRLRSSDIRRVADVIRDRREIAKFSRRVSRDEIRKNEYNLNIPRYVDSAETAEMWDIYSTMYGGIPNNEILMLSNYWDTFPQLKGLLFEPFTQSHSQMRTDNIEETIIGSEEIKHYEEQYQAALLSFPDYLHKQLILQDYNNINVTKHEDTITNELFHRVEDIPLLDKYQAYQLFSNEWQTIAGDLEILQTEGLAAARVVEPNMVFKKKKVDGEDKEIEVQEGWKGRIMPFELVQRIFLAEEYNQLQADKKLQESILADIDMYREQLPEEQREKIIDEEKNKVDNDKLTETVNEAYEQISDTVTTALRKYLQLLANKASKAEKLTFIKESDCIDWSILKANKDGTYSEKETKIYLNNYCSCYTFDEDNEYFAAVNLLRSMVILKYQKIAIKLQETQLEEKTKECIINLSDEDVKRLLVEKWIYPLQHSLLALPRNIVAELVQKVKALAVKYQDTLLSIGNELQEAQAELSEMIDHLTGNEEDMKALLEFQKLLK